MYISAAEHAAVSVRLSDPAITRYSNFGEAILQPRRFCVWGLLVSPICRVTDHEQYRDQYTPNLMTKTAMPNVEYTHHGKSDVLAVFFFVVSFYSVFLDIQASSMQ